ncbi:MAG: hypothetical protein AB1606_07850 [Nitrospirota bacterium]
MYREINIEKLKTLEKDLLDTASILRLFHNSLSRYQAVEIFLSKSLCIV